MDRIFYIWIGALLSLTYYFVSGYYYGILIFFGIITFASFIALLINHYQNKPTNR